MKLILFKKQLLELLPIKYNLCYSCTWCPDVHRCSDGADRLREHWDTNECGIKNISTIDQCANIKVYIHLNFRK